MGETSVMEKKFRVINLYLTVVIGLRILSLRREAVPQSAAALLATRRQREHVLRGWGVGVGGRFCLSASSELRADISLHQHK